MKVGDLLKVKMSCSIPFIGVVIKVNDRGGGYIRAITYPFEGQSRWIYPRHGHILERLS